MLRFRYKMRHRNLPKASGRDPVTGHGLGPRGRIERLRKLVTATVRHERIEGCRDYVDETRGYVERLIQLAIQNGDRHKPTMEMADYWLLDKDLIHKLFKVIVPRYTNYSTSYTCMHRLPTEYPGGGMPLAVLELRGNPWPPIGNKSRDTENTLLNVLMTAARQSYRREKYDNFAKTLESSKSQSGENTTDSENNSVLDTERNTTKDTIQNTDENLKFSSSISRDNVKTLPIEGTPV